MAKSKYVGYTKEQLIIKIEKLEKHRYVLVWEDKEEAIAERCEQELPVLIEGIKKKIDVIYTEPPGINTEKTANKTG